jgi:hypothetical protein
VRQRLLPVIAVLAGLVLLAAAVWRALHEPADTNSFALLADAFLKGRFDFVGCYDSECVGSNGRTYLIQPPFPAALVTPLVAVYGVHFKGFIFTALALDVASGLVWWRILTRIGIEGRTTFWVILALMASTPLAYTTLRADGVWLFAHVVGVLMTSIAIHEALAARLLSAGLFLGFAFLSRQMSLFLLPFVLAVSLSTAARILPPNRETVVKALKLGVAFALSLGFYVFYNWQRFGLPMETGHSILQVQSATSTDITMITHRLRDGGVFSTIYIPFNVFYMFLQGFHAEFSGLMQTKLSGLDPSGASFLAASPFLIFLFLTPRDRTLFWGIVSILPIIALLLVYHSNGFKQYNAHRYVLDFMPVLLVFIARAIKPETRPVFGLLVTWGIVLNIAMVGVLAVTHG